VCVCVKYVKRLYRDLNMHDACLYSINRYKADVFENFVSEQGDIILFLSIGLILLGKF
jgi:hypothetical protein